MLKYYDKGDIQLYLGDCIEILEKAAPESVDMIFADPPYMLSNGGISCQAGKVVCVNKGKWDKSKGLDEDFAFHQKWINACRRVLKPNGTIWVSGTYHSIYACGFALQKTGFKILNDICWFKPNASPNMSCRYFTASHETLIWARKDPKGKHVFNYETMKNGDWLDDEIKKPNKQMRSVWQIDTPKSYEKTFGKHPTQKPEGLYERMVLASSNENDIVLDPFLGSGTSVIASEQCNRKCIGFEYNEGFQE